MILIFASSFISFFTGDIDQRLQPGSQYTWAGFVGEWHWRSGRFSCMVWPARPCLPSVAAWSSLVGSARTLPLYGT
jgi:hypothetical protein